MIREVVSRGYLGTAFSLWLVFAWGCGERVAPPDRVAEVDGEALSYQAFEEFLERNSVAGAGVLGSDVLSSLLDQFLDEQLLMRLASERLAAGQAVEPRSAARLLLEESQVVIDAEAVALFYRQNVSQFELLERLVLRQLLFAERPEADRIRDLWVQGEPYKTIVDQVANVPGAHVGEEGEFSREDLPPDFAQALFGLSEGDISEVLPADYGFHVFQVVRRLPGGLVPLREVSQTIRTDLENRHIQETLWRLVTEARERYNVLVFERNLPFNYVGIYGSSHSDENT